MQNNRRKLQQQILLKYKLKQIIRMQNQINMQNAQLQNAQLQNALENFGEVIVKEQISNVLDTINECVVEVPLIEQISNDLVSVSECIVEDPLIDHNYKKLAVIKSKIMTDYSNLYKTK